MSQQHCTSEDASTLRALLDALRDLHRSDLLYNAIGAFDRIEFTIAEQAAEIARLKEEVKTEREYAEKQLDHVVGLEAKFAALRAAPTDAQREQDKATMRDVLNARALDIHVEASDYERAFAALDRLAALPLGSPA